MSTARSASIRASITVMLMCGTKSPREPWPIDPSARIEYTNVATNVPSVSCVPRSRMKLRSMRGPNWVDVSVRATITIENTTPTTVMIAAAIAVRICRAASADPLIGHPEHPVVGGTVQRVGADEQQHGGEDLDRGNQPQVGAQHLAAPLRATQEPSDHRDGPRF